MGDNNSLLKPYQKTAGALLFLAGSVCLMDIITAETFYPGGYSTSANEISDMGSTMPPNSIILWLFGFGGNFLGAQSANESIERGE